MKNPEPATMRIKVSRIAAASASTAYWRLTALPPGRPIARPERDRE